MPSYDEGGAHATDAQPRKRCDHVCLGDDDHVERGEPHFYGYRMPLDQEAAAEIERLSLALIEAQNPGIDMEEVRRARGA